MTDSSTNETKNQPVIFSGWNPLLPLPLPGAAVEISIKNDQNRKQDQNLSRSNTFVPAVKIMEDGTSNKRKKKKHGEIMEDELQVMEDSTSNRRKKKKHGEVEDKLKAVEIMEDDTSNKRKKKQRGGGSICNSFVDVLVELLSQLPASSLSRFRFVCKSWLTLIITDPILPQMHFDRGLNPPAVLVSSSALPTKQLPSNLTEPGLGAQAYCFDSGVEFGQDLPFLQWPAMHLWFQQNYLALQPH